MTEIAVPFFYKHTLLNIDCTVVVENGVVDSDSDEDYVEYNSDQETDDEIELNLSQEQEQIAKILSPKKKSTTTRKNAKQRADKNDKVPNGKLGKGM